MATKVRLAALREIPEHIPAFVGLIRAGVDRPERTTRFLSGAQQLLMRSPWLGKVAELRRIVELLVKRMPGRIMQAAGLPATIRQAGSR
ncbi:hypothetical protein ACFXG4_42300 [Nocardia sp. NPDC059246]|uniref:hypothetical protein n=1 Tax=unclassified Nocardia TaxID=2637762 RepID=UPI0036BAA07C